MISRILLMVFVFTCFVPGLKASSYPIIIKLDLKSLRKDGVLPPEVLALKALKDYRDLVSLESLLKKGEKISILMKPTDRKYSRWDSIVILKFQNDDFAKTSLISLKKRYASRISEEQGLVTFALNKSTSFYLKRVNQSLFLATNHESLKDISFVDEEILGAVSVQGNFSKVPRQLIDRRRRDPAFSDVRKFSFILTKNNGLNLKGEIEAYDIQSAEKLQFWSRLAPALVAYKYPSLAIEKNLSLSSSSLQVRFQWQLSEKEMSDLLKSLNLSD